MRKIGNGVVSVPWSEHEHVRLAPARKGVVPGVTLNPVDAGAALNRVAAATADDRIVARIAREGVVTLVIAF